MQKMMAATLRKELKRKRKEESDEESGWDSKCPLDSLASEFCSPCSLKFDCLHGNKLNKKLCVNKNLNLTSNESSNEPMNKLIKPKSILRKKYLKSYKKNKKNYNVRFSLTVKLPLNNEKYVDELDLFRLKKKRRLKDTTVFNEIPNLVLRHLT